MNKSKVPEFTSVKEEAEFWDSQDITDYLGELAIVKGVYQPREGKPKRIMTVRIAPSLKEQLEKVAQSYDISTSSLVRMWIVDKLRSLHQE